MPKMDIKDLCNVPVIHNVKDLESHLRPLYIMEDYMRDHDTYRMLEKEISNIVKGCFTIADCREYPIHFKFYKKEAKTHELQLRHFLVNIYAWFPLIEIESPEQLNETFIINCFTDIPVINNYINTKLIGTLRAFHVKNTTMNFALSEALYNLRSVSLDFSTIMNLNFSMETFIKDYNEDPEIHDIMECHLEASKQPYEIEQQLAALQARYIQILKSKSNHPVGVILNAGSGIKLKQLGEFAIADGLKPNLTGETIPLPIENSRILKGIDRPSYAYIDAIGARKSLVMNKKVMGKAGYFGKIVLMLARTLSMSTTVSDCETKHLVAYEVKNKDTLKRLNGKFYKLDRKDIDLKIIDAKKDTDLLGKTVYVRSAATCALGDHVCTTCIGMTSVLNQDIANGLSAFESEEITKVINQSILSTKHLLTTDSEKIEFNEDFFKFFTCISGEIYPVVNDNTNVEDIDDYAIYVNPDDIMKVDEMDDESLFNVCIMNGKFYIRNLADPKAKDILISTSEEKEIFITEEAHTLMKKGKGLIRFKDLDDDTKLFEIIIMNNELTKPLYELMNLLNKSRADEIHETIDTMSQKFMDLLNESHIQANIVAAELITNRLIRSREHPYERPNFTKEMLEPYDIITVRKALLNNRSPLIGSSFQNIKQQFLSDAYFKDRTGTSFIDSFYKTEIPTDNFKKYSKLIAEGIEDD